MNGLGQQRPLVTALRCSPVVDTQHSVVSPAANLRSSVGRQCRSSDTHSVDVTTSVIGLGNYTSLAFVCWLLLYLSCGQVDIWQLDVALFWYTLFTKLYKSLFCDKYFYVWSHIYAFAGDYQWKSFCFQAICESMIIYNKFLNIISYKPHVGISSNL